MTEPVTHRPQLFQPRLPENADVKIIGLGGVGSIVARYGSLFLASLGGEVRVVLIDGDAFEPSNASRMFFGDCGNKAVVTRNELLPRFTETRLSLLAVAEYLTPDNAGRLLRDGDIVLLTVDNHATRKLVNDHCARLNNVCLVSGGNDGVGGDAAGNFRRGTYGNVQLYLRAKGEEVTPPLTHHHPEIANPADQLPTEQSCTDLVTSVPQILFANLSVASAILNTLWLYLSGALRYRELAFDIADGLMRPVASLRAPIGIRAGPRRGSNPEPVFDKDGR
jgi:molybdopterin/thiamine biosynthesis adenylyltransferase